MESHLCDQEAVVSGVGSQTTATSGESDRETEPGTGRSSSEVVAPDPSKRLHHTSARSVSTCSHSRTEARLILFQKRARCRSVPNELESRRNPCTMPHPALRDSWRSNPGASPYRLRLSHEYADGGACAFGVPREGDSNRCAARVSQGNPRRKLSSRSESTGGGHPFRWIPACVRITLRIYTAQAQAISDRTAVTGHVLTQTCRIFILVSRPSHTYTLGKDRQRNYRRS